MIDWEIMETSALRLAELKHGVRTGAEYQYSSLDGSWYCYAHKSRRHRWLKQPALFSRDLKKVAILKGAREGLFARRIEIQESTSKSSGKKTKRKSKTFIPLF